MTTSILRPNATISAAGSTLTGAATVHAATNDNSDSSFASFDDSQLGGNASVVGLGTVTLPAGAVTKTVRVRARVRGGGQEGGIHFSILGDAGGGYAAISVVDTESVGSFTEIFGPEVPVNLAQAAVDELHIRCGCNAFPQDFVLTTDVDFAELYLDLVYATIPVANITYPTGTPAITTTNKPTYTWTYTAGSDGGAQSFYEVKVYTAAQYGAGGFSPDTSTTFWTSGVTVGAATSQLSGVLTNSTTYRVYVRTAQTVNGVAHWSAWDFEGFSISVTTANVSAITTTADNTNGRILVAVDRSGSAWDFVEVQRSIDAGTTWEYIRGGEYVVPATTTLFSTGDANNFDIYDYELPNAQTALYRARATRIVSLLPITGAWVQSTPAISWTSTSTFLKNPTTPSFNQTVIVNEFPPLEHPVRQTAFQVLGRADPVVISDTVRQLAVGSVTLITLDEADADDLFALVGRTDTLLFQSPSTDRFGSRYIAAGSLTEIRGALTVGTTTHLWALPFVEVFAPADSLAGSP